MNDCLIERFNATRLQSISDCQPLEIEDYGLQADAFASPPKWHLAHTSWFFETFLLKPFMDDYTVYDPAYEVLFNSYYNAIGEQFPRPQRGLLSRPTVAEVYAYREHVNNAMNRLLQQTNHSQRESILERCELGIEHERQHQELFFTDLKYSLSKNPLLIQYQLPEQQPLQNQQKTAQPENTGQIQQWCHFDGGLIEIGAPTDISFSFDNEHPRHKVFLGPFALANTLITNGDFLAFIEDGGYQKSQYWLADGWTFAQQNQWQHPLYWSSHEGDIQEYSLYGSHPLDPNQPVCHISAYEADAYANWAGLRLATEAEWEYAASQHTQSQIHTHQHRHPQPATASGSVPLLQLYGDCWQWTSSAYRPYPGYEIAEGAIGEYNGKFMCNQWVLRGGSCVSNDQSVRPSYRNFFYPQDRWQFSGIRLAKNL